MNNNEFSDMVIDAAPPPNYCAGQMVYVVASYEIDGEPVLMEVLGIIRRVVLHYQYDPAERDFYVYEIHVMGMTGLFRDESIIREITNAN